MDVVPQKARTEDSLLSPSGEGQTTQVLRSYGVGIDCHSRFIQVCVLVNDGSGVRRFDREFTTDWADLTGAEHWVRSVLNSHLPDPPRRGETLRYTLESTGTYHLPVIRAFAGTPSVVNPLLASPSRRKTDVLDARLLAHHAITGLWPASYVATDVVQTLRIIMAMREKAVRAGSRATNRINNIILRFGHTVGAHDSVRSPAIRAVVEDLARGLTPDHPGVAPFALPAHVQGVVTALYRDYDESAARSKAYLAKALAHVRDNEWVTGAGEAIGGRKMLDLLKSVPGIGDLSAIAWLSEVVVATRFPNAKAVAAFCGCDPSLKVSAGKVTQHTRRAGNKRLHRHLSQAASHLMVSRREPFGQWGYSLAKRHQKGGWKKAVGAVARRLAVALFHVQRLGVPFSYDGYKFWAAPDVPDVPIDAMGLGRFERKLEELGLRTSVQVVNAYVTTLAGEKGIGAKCLASIKEWVTTNSRTATAAAAKAFLESKPPPRGPCGRPRPRATRLVGSTG